MIEARGADQEARAEIAVEDLSFTIRPGDRFPGSVVVASEHHSTNAASVRSFGERETVKVTIPEALGEKHGAQREAVDDCRVRHRAGALAAGAYG